MPLSLKPPRDRRIASNVQRAVQRISQRFNRGRIKLDTGRNAGRNRRFVGVNDCVGESTYASDDRRRAISERTKLSETARLETRRHHDEIGTGLDQMGECLVVAENATDGVRPRRGEAR